MSRKASAIGHHLLKVKTQSSKSPMPEMSLTIPVESSWAVLNTWNSGGEEKLCMNACRITNAKKTVTHAIATTAPSFNHKRALNFFMRVFSGTGIEIVSVLTV